MRNFRGNSLRYPKRNSDRLVRKPPDCRQSADGGSDDSQSGSAARLAAEDRATPADLEKVSIVGPNNWLIPLPILAHLEEVHG